MFSQLLLEDKQKNDSVELNQETSVVWGERECVGTAGRGLRMPALWHSYNYNSYNFAVYKLRLGRSWVGHGCLRFLQWVLATCNPHAFDLVQSDTPSSTCLLLCLCKFSDAVSDFSFAKPVLWILQFPYLLGTVSPPNCSASVVQLGDREGQNLPFGSVQVQEIWHVWLHGWGMLQLGRADNLLKNIFWIIA